MPNSDFHKEESMKSQATVHSITRKPNVPGIPTAHSVTITIDQNGNPNLPPGSESLQVATGDTVTWTCTPPQDGGTGILSLCFDPFHAVPLFMLSGNPGSPISIPTYPVMAAQGQKGKSFHYHISWTDAVHGTHGHDPVIIVDPMGGLDE